MPRIIMKSPYIKPNSKIHIGNYVSYIATRDGVDNADSTQKFMEATERQKHIIKKKNWRSKFFQRACSSLSLKKHIKKERYKIPFVKFIS